MYKLIPVLLMLAECLSQTGSDLSVLVFTATGGVRHESIPAGISALEEMGAEYGFRVVNSENLDDINLEYLSQFNTLLWMNTTGNIFGTQQKEALMDYIAAGGGWVGLHGAANFEGGVRWTDWDWFGGLLGGSAWYHSNPYPDFYTDSRCIREVSDHPAVRHFPDTFNYTSEYFNFVNNPRDDPDVTVLVSVDETSYDPGDGAMGDHPVVWCKAYDGGRSLYTTWGHGIDEYDRPEFRLFLLGAIRWTAGQEEATGVEKPFPIIGTGFGNLPEPGFNAFRMFSLNGRLVPMREAARVPDAGAIRLMNPR